MRFLGVLKVRRFHALVILSVIAFSIPCIYQIIRYNHTLTLDRSIKHLVSIGPYAGGKADSIIFLLQGSGMNPEDMVILAENMAPRFPHTLFIAPEAILVDTNPDAHKWYNILEKNEENVSAHGVYKAGKVSTYLIEKLHRQTGIPYNKIGIFGFSQGASVALQVAMNAPKPLWGVVSFAGILFAEEKGKNIVQPYETMAVTDGFDNLDIPYIETPLLLVQGKNDPVVNNRYGEATSKALKLYTAEMDWYFVPHMGHEVRRDMLDNAVEFFRKHQKGAQR